MYYIALLRGINVGGHRVVKMGDLRSIFTQMGLGEVRTYIQSGNVFFESFERDTTRLESRIESELARQLGFEVPTLIRDVSMVQALAAQHPFELLPAEEHPVYVVFLKSEPSPDRLAALLALNNAVETLMVEGQQLYLRYHREMGKLRFTNTFIERMLRGAATTRNWVTLVKMMRGELTQGG